MIKENFREIVDVCEKFADKEISGSVLDADLAHDQDWAKAVFLKSREIGLPGLLISEQYGGVEQPDICAALVLDVLASRCAGAASVFANHFVGCKVLAGGDNKQQAHYLPMLSNSESKDMYAAAVIFPGYLDDSSLSLKEEGGRLLLSGLSPLTGSVYLAELFIVFVTEDESGAKPTCLIVERNAPGVSIDQSAGLPGLKVNPFAAVNFQDVEIKSEAIIGERGGAGPIYEAARNLLYGLCAGMAMGISRTAYGKARDYAANRYQYGKSIIYHSDIQRKLGRMLMQINVGTAAYVHFMNGETTGLPCTSGEACHAKIFCTEAAENLTIEAIQIHGGYGYMHEYGVEKLLRDAKVLCMLGGSSPYLHVEAVSREL